MRAKVARTHPFNPVSKLMLYVWPENELEAIVLQAFKNQDAMDHVVIEAVPRTEAL
jgi:hypothetical protein